MVEITDEGNTKLTCRVCTAASSSKYRGANVGLAQARTYLPANSSFQPSWMAGYIPRVTKELSPQRHTPTFAV